MMSKNKTIFKKGSVTYYTSSIFFPGNIREDVTDLYAFVRTVDDFVDRIPQDKTGFDNFYKQYKSAISGKEIENQLINKFVRLSEKYVFDPKWIESFFASMKQDFRKTDYKNLGELEDYMYGSAEVIGLMMAKILHLPKASYKYAQTLGKSMQFANFIRDIKHDHELGRVYVPETHLNKFSLESFESHHIQENLDSFISLIRYECEKYFHWQEAAEKGFKYIKKHSLIPIETASDMYKWTMNKISKNPALVLDKQLKPQKARIILKLVANSLGLVFIVLT